MTDLADRYGSGSRARKLAIVALVSGLAVIGLAWLAWAAIYQSNPQVRSGSLGFTIASDHLATGSYTVHRSGVDVEAECFLRAIAEDHSIVGELTQRVDSGAAVSSPTFELRTERRATTVELLGCTAPHQPQRK